MAQVQAPENTTPQTETQRPVAPPEEAFWVRYSPHHEFPLSTVSSFALHFLVLALLILAGWVALKLGLANQARPLPVDVVSLAGGGPDGTGPGPGGDPPREDVPPAGPNQPAPTVQAPTFPENVLGDPLAVLAYKNSDTGRRVLDVAGRSAEQLAALNKETRQRLWGALGDPGKAGNGAGPGTGPGPGPGNGRLSAQQRRVLRWTMVFNVTGGEDYARQLRALGAIIVVPEPDGQYKVIRDLEQRPAQGQMEDLAQFKTIFFVDDRRESVESLVRTLGLSRVPSYFIAFFPLAVENHLVKIEHDYKGLAEEDIYETRFEVVRDVGSGSFVPRVTSQTPISKRP